MNNKGYFRSSPGKYDKMECDICQDIMDVKRNCEGAKSWAGAMGGMRSEPYDLWTCPNLEKKWHKQVTELLEETKNSASPTLAKIFLQDAKEVLQTRQSTKSFRPY